MQHKELDEYNKLDIIEKPMQRARCFFISIIINNALCIINVFIESWVFLVVDWSL